MRKTELISLVKEVLEELDEANVTGGSATFTAGTGATYATPNFLGKATRAKKTLKKQGYKEVK
jgi:hypothetical protein